MADEDVLKDAPYRRVVRVGDTVRRPTHPMATGYEQVRSIVAALAGAEDLAQRLGVGPELHTSLLHGTASGTLALQLAAYAADLFDVPGTSNC